MYVSIERKGRRSKLWVTSETLKAAIERGLIEVSHCRPFSPLVGPTEVPGPEKPSDVLQYRYVGQTTADGYLFCSESGRETLPWEYGVPINGIIVDRVRCIGCLREFDMYRRECDLLEPESVCDGCAETMRP